MTTEHIGEDTAYDLHVPTDNALLEPQSAKHL